MSDGTSHGHLGTRRVALRAPEAGAKNITPDENFKERGLRRAKASDKYQSNPERLDLPIGNAVQPSQALPQPPYTVAPPTPAKPHRGSVGVSQGVNGAARVAGTGNTRFEQDFASIFGD